MNLELKTKLDQLQAKRSDLALKKLDLKNESGILKNKVRMAGRMPQREYRDTCAKQNEIKRAIFSLEKQMAEAKQEIRSLELQRLTEIQNEPVVSDLPETAPGRFIVNGSAILQWLVTPGNTLQHDEDGSYYAQTKRNGKILMVEKGPTITAVFTALHARGEV